MNTDAVLRIAREIVGNVAYCKAIRVDRNGEAQARVVNQITHRRLGRLGLGKGWHCLEIGGGGE